MEQTPNETLKIVHTVFANILEIENTRQLCEQKLLCKKDYLIYSDLLKTDIPILIKQLILFCQKNA